MAGFGAMLPAMEHFGALEAAGGSADQVSNAFVIQMMQMQLSMMLLNIVQLLMTAVIYTAVMRAVVRPTETSWFSLRLGMDELRVAVAGIAIFGGAYVALMVCVLLLVGIGFAAFAADPTVGTIVMIILGLGLMVGFWIAVMRICLIGPASVLYRGFAFAEGWRLARGQTMRLFGMSLLLVLIVWALEIVIVAIGMGIFLAAGGAGLAEHAESALNPFQGWSAWMTANWIWVVVGGIVGSAVYGVLLTLGVAPFASACRQLAQTDQAADTF